MQSVVACIVTYNPSPEVRLTLCSVLSQVSAVFVIDNSSEAESQVALARLCTDVGAILLVNSENAGVAAAFNQAARIAIGQGYDWMLLMDQDSVAPMELVLRLMSCAERWQGTRPPAVLCPRSIRNDQSGEKAAIPDVDIAVKTCMNAGSIVRLSAWKSVGGYDEGFFVDYVDHDFCFKCRQHGWNVVQASGAVMIHSPGNPTGHRFLWRRRITSNHSALRRYYIARNRILFYRRYWRFDTSWVFHDACHAVKEALAVLLFESGRREKLNAICAGVVDGFRGLSGRTPRKWSTSET